MTDFVSAARGFPFRVGTPWALVERNSGHQIVYLVEERGDADNPRAPLTRRGYIWSETSQSYSRTARPIRYEQIRRRWRNPPSDDAIRKAKGAANKRLRALEKTGHFGRALRRAA